MAATLILTFSLMATQFFSGGLRLDLLLLMATMAYVLSLVVLQPDVKGWEYLTLLTLPAFYTAAVFVFYFLLPTRWLTRLPIAFLYALGMYAIFLTENIYNVAAERNIQLLRAAHSVGFLLSILTTFFLVDTVLSLHLIYYLNVLLIGLIIFPLSIQALWTMELTENITGKTWWGSVCVTLVMSELVLVFSFWPIRVTIEALFLTTVFYCLVGMMQQYLVERLFPKTTREYLLVFVLVFLLVLFTTKWGVGIQ
ncbi:MAG: hypothetical protein UV17_C0030G0006 [Candidatus Gottesmanbacteria bacterium GW2011_GWA1_42_26]|nr:MAG: hypothetical protein UV17_C0030G0006 [Candidatus Gottesmanbacteria bacterium GW2011_GWA1_42_26]